MPRRRDPNFKTGHLCRFCGELVPWGTILRLIRVDPDTPGFMRGAGDLSFRCNVNYNGYVTSIRVERNYNRGY